MPHRKHPFQSNSTSVCTMIALAIALIVTLGAHVIPGQARLNSTFHYTGETRNDQRDILRVMFQLQEKANMKRRQQYTQPTPKNQQRGRARPRQLRAREGDKWREEEPTRPSQTLYIFDSSSSSSSSDE
jgi:hypothetical protein